MFGTLYETFDSPLQQGGFTAVPIKPASFFAACLAEGTVDAYGRCLASALERCP